MPYLSLSEQKGIEGLLKTRRAVQTHQMSSGFSGLSKISFGQYSK